MHPLGGLSAPNVTRIVVQGSTNPTEYLRLTVDPGSPDVFSWQRVPVDPRRQPALSSFVRSPDTHPTPLRQLVFIPPP